MHKLNVIFKVWRHRTNEKMDGWVQKNPSSILKSNLFPVKTNALNAFNEDGFDILRVFFDFV